MRAAERLVLSLRHHRLFRRANAVWDVLRPLYDRLVSAAGKEGLIRVINGTDSIRIASQFRHIGEVYEPKAWSQLMDQIRPGDCIADVGAHVGLYSLAMAQRAGASGRVVCFEPDPSNFNPLQTHIAMNHLESRIEAIQAAVGA